MALLGRHAGLRYLSISSASTIYCSGLCWDKLRLISSVGTFLAALGALAITQLLATLSWRYFEQPLIRMGRRTNFEFGAAEPLKTPPSGVRLVYR